MKKQGEAFCAGALWTEASVSRASVLCRRWHLGVGQVHSLPAPAVKLLTQSGSWGHTRHSTEERQAGLWVDETARTGPTPTCQSHDFPAYSASFHHPCASLQCHQMFVITWVDCCRTCRIEPSHIGCPDTVAHTWFIFWSDCLHLC